jgi:hypothetical protein
MKMDLEKVLWENVDWIHVVVSCQHNNKLAGCVKCGKFFEYLRNYWILNKDSVP